MCGKAGAMSGIVSDRRERADRFRQPSVEPLNHPICLRPVRTGQAVLYPVAGAELIKRVGACWPRLVAGFGAVLEAVGELRTVVAQNRVNLMPKRLQEPLHRSRDRSCAPIR